MIHFFRHADAGRRGHGDRTDRERPLSDLGWREARVIAERLAGAGVTRILTSPYVRCVQSVEPLSAATGVPVEIERSLEEGAGPARVDTLLGEIESGTVLCTHGDIVSALIRRLSAEGASLSGGLIWEKGSVWHLEPGRSGRIRSGVYEPPPITDP